MGAKKKDLFADQQYRDAELGFVISSPARIEILRYLESHFMTNVPILEQYIPLHKKTINHHVSLIERSGLIVGYYVGNTYFWSKNEQLSDDWNKIRWVL